MKTVIVCFFIFIASIESKEKTQRKRRGHFDSTYDLVNSLKTTSGPLLSYQKEQVISTPSVDLSLYQLTSNSLEKPVQESQDNLPPQPAETAIIPDQPPPAIPVAAYNLPGDGNSIFLGSGSLGVLNLGGGAYVLGAGSLGYSDIRRNPRPSIKVATLPPIQASPNLLPAAVQSPKPIKPIFSYSFPPGHHNQVDDNGYEVITPDQVGFGDPLPYGPLKITNNYAVPTKLLLPPRPQPIHINGFRPSQPVPQIQPIPNSLTISHAYSISQPITHAQAVTVQSESFDLYPKKVSNLHDYLKK